MRQKIIIALSIFLVSSLLFSACELSNCDCYCSNYDADELTLNDTIELKYTELYCNPEYELRLSFDSIADSRCPIGAICVWEGNASVDLIITQYGESEAIIRLNTYGGFLTDTTVNGLRYELIDLLPYPVIDKDYVLDDYILHLKISD